MVFKKRQFTDNKRIDLKKCAPYILHFVIVIGVTSYVLLGALVVREIERIHKDNLTIEMEERYSMTGEVDRVRRDTQHKIRRGSMNRTRRCVIAALHRIHALTNCTAAQIQGINLNFLDACYHNDLKEVLEKESEERDEYTFTKNSGQEVEMVLDGDFYRWRFTDAVLFCFTVITTIGYGNVAPKTFYGRLFVIFYGLIGVPLTMLAIANLGKFLAAMLRTWTRPFINCFGKARKRYTKRGASSREKERLMDSNGNISKQKEIEEEGEGEEEDKEEPEDEDESNSDAIVLFVSFVIYIVIGSVVISTYEPQMDFFEAIYFNFVTLTTIGLGDLVPQSESYLVCTLIYCAIGLALTTIAIEIAADYLKKLHYFGRKIDNAGGVKVWFGGQKITMRQLVKNLGDQFNVPVEQLEKLNIGQFVDDAMKVESGQLASLRKPHHSSDYWRAIEGSSLHFVDDDDMIAAQTRNYYAAC